MIRLDNVTKTFTSEKSEIHAVNGVSLTVEKGDVFGVIGFSGAGKSTLIRCINLLERPTSGKVFLRDVELTAQSADELRRQRLKIGMIFQQFNLFASRTVFKNVAFPLQHRGMKKEELQKKVMSLLELVDLADKANAYPSELSGGQKQRVAIARALANDPEILLCDEATSALDPQTTHSILQLIKKLNRTLGITVVLITHEMQVVKEICNRVAVMENGKIVESGDVLTVFANPKERITREFVDMTSNVSGVKALIKENAPITRLEPGQCMLRFKYIDRSASDALVSYLSRTYGVDLNIIFGNIDIIGGIPVGSLVVIAEGTNDAIKKCIAYLENINVGVEVILDARISE